MAEQDRELVALGRAIRQTREEQGMTPAELAAAADTERECLEALEAGRLTPADDLLLGLAAGLGIDPDVLVSSAGYLDTSAVCAAFGRRLRDLRTERGISQEDLARRTGINRTSIGTCERGGSDPRLTTIRLLAHGLQVPPRELIEDETEPRVS